MRQLLPYAATPAAVGGGMTVIGSAPLPAVFVGLLAALAVGAFHAVTSGDLL